MRFLVDESADGRLASHLTALGHDAALVARAYRAGISDEEVLAIARSEHRTLITDDRDFGELITQRRLPHAGVIYFRLRTTLLSAKIERLEYILEHHAERLDQFLIVTERRVRVRTPSRPPPDG